MALVIVIDALYECDDKMFMSELIEIIISACDKDRGMPLRILITSRVEHIRQKLDTSAAHSVVHC
jgi:hypothetical protein